MEKLSHAFGGTVWAQWDKRMKRAINKSSTIQSHMSLQTLHIPLAPGFCVCMKLSNIYMNLNILEGYQRKTRSTCESKSRNPLHSILSYLNVIELLCVKGKDK